jgi:3-hydroxyacyl-[acyl-carrier-protein] dehydratase
MSEAVQLDVQEILRWLPHRYPFLLVDRVLECRMHKSIRALKNVTVNEPFFMGHFPERPVMPGVLIIEALAQAAGVLLFASHGVVPDRSARFYFAGIDKARFRKPVLPGDQLILTAKLERNMRSIWRVATTALVGEDVVCEAELLLSFDFGNAAGVKVPE